RSGWNRSPSDFAEDIWNLAPATTCSSPPWPGRLLFEQSSQIVRQGRVSGREAGQANALHSLDPAEFEPGRNRWVGPLPPLRHGGFENSTCGAMACVLIPLVWPASFRRNTDGEPEVSRIKEEDNV